MRYIEKQPAESMEAFKDYYLSPNEKEHLKQFQSLIKQIFKG